MAVRDISASSWNAPGTVQLGLSIVMSNKGQDPLTLPLWLNSYSVSSDTTYDLSSGFNAVPVLSTNVRLWILIPPAGNTQTIVLKGITGDTGVAQNANGIIVLTLPASGAPTTIGITAGTAVAGCRLIQG